MTEGVDLPWLQDLDTTDVWSAWQISYRDVIVLNAENEFESLVNVTTENLTTDVGYNTLKNLIIEAANP